MSIKKFYDLEARKITADGEKIKLFTNHPGTLGAYREARLRAYLSEHVPSRFVVSSGFITDHDHDGENVCDRSSKQIDCLVYDATLFAPLLQTTDFAIVVPESAVAVVEIKSNLTLFKSRTKASDRALPWKDDKGGYVWDGTLIDALENIKSAIAILEAAKVSRDSYFAGIMSYSSSMDQFISAMTSGELVRQLSLKDIDEMPSDICVFGGSWFGMSAYQWLEDPEFNQDYHASPEFSFLMEGKSVTEGNSLQLFTAGMNYRIAVSRGNAKHVVEGLRSGVGYTGEVITHKVDLPSPRQHQADVISVSGSIS